MLLYHVQHFIRKPIHLPGGGHTPQVHLYQWTKQHGIRATMRSQHYRIHKAKPNQCQQQHQTQQ